MPNNDYRTANTYHPQMDGFRGLFCIFIIIIHHHFSYANLPVTLGYFGMHGFFILSSFLITRGLLLDKPKAKSFRDFYITFYIKRILRIFPVYFLYLALALAVGIATADSPMRQALGILYELKHFGWMLVTFTYNFKDLYCIYSGDIYNMSLVFPHLWSLSLEEQFYFIVPFMIYFLEIKTLKRLTIAMILLFPLIRAVGFPWLGTLTSDVMQQSFIFYRNTFFQYDAFFYGSFLALFHVNISDRKLFALFYTVTAVFLLLIPVNAWILHQQSGLGVFHHMTQYDFMTRNGQYLYIDTLFNIVCSIFFFICFSRPDRFSFFRNTFLVGTGSKLTYSAYVYQYILIIPTLLFLLPFLRDVLQWPLPLAELISLFISVSLVLLLSYLSFGSLESYFLQKKNYLITLYRKPG